MSMQICDDVALKSQVADPSTPLVVDIFTPDCGYCVRMDPHISRLAEEREGSIRFVKCDAEEYPMVGVDFGVRTVPLVVLYKDGVEVARRGSGDYDELTAWLAEHGL